MKSKALITKCTAQLICVFFHLCKNRVTHSAAQTFWHSGPKCIKPGQGWSQTVDTAKNPINAVNISRKILIYTYQDNNVILSIFLEICQILMVASALDTNKTGIKMVLMEIQLQDSLIILILYAPNIYGIYSPPNKT